MDDLSKLQRHLSDQERREAFARVFAQNNRWLYAYLMTLLGKAADAEEVFQEVCVVLWREYEVFDPDTDFKKWASVIARHRVMRFRALESRRARQLSDRAVELLAEQAVEEADLLEDRRQALHGCLEKLAPADRELVATCYGELECSFRQVAEQLGRPANTVYKALQRIRRALRTCVERAVATES